MAAHFANRVTFVGSKADINAAPVIAINDHHMAIGHRQNALFAHEILKRQQYRAAFDLDQCQNICPDITDHAPGVKHRGLVHRPHAKLAPADPVITAIGLDIGLFWRARA